MWKQHLIDSPLYWHARSTVSPRYGPALDYYMSIEVRDKANEIAKEVLDNFEEEEVWCQCEVPSG